MYAPWFKHGDFEYSLILLFLFPKLTLNVVFQYELILVLEQSEHLNQIVESGRSQYSKWL